jgi:hypothetical protein
MPVFLANSFEVFHRFFIESNGYLNLQALDVWIIFTLHLTEVIFFSHDLFPPTPQE